MKYNLEIFGQNNSLSQDFKLWADLESYFHSRLDSKDLESRDYKKIMLAQYSSMIVRNYGKHLTTDEKGLMAVLQFKQKALVRSLYPGLLSRIFYHVRTSMQDSINTRKELQMAKMANDERLIRKPVEQTEQEKTGIPQQNTEGSRIRDTHPQQRYGPDLGVRKPMEQKPGGPSI